MSDAGIQKSAILMLALGHETAAEVMKYLEPREVEKLSTAMSLMNSVSKDNLDAVIDEFNAETADKAGFNVDSQDYIAKVLTKALGIDKASNLLNRILISNDTTGIENLKWMDAKSVANLIQLEHPQIIATILVHLEPFHASEIISELSEQIRSEVILRIATLDGVQPTALKELNDVLSKLLTNNNRLNKKAIGGISATAAIMSYMNGEIETALMTKLTEFDPEIAQQITDQMFVFENILDIQDRDLQLVLREVGSETLIMALKGAKDDVKAKIFKNMSQRAAEMMQEDMDAKGPVRLSDVVKQQKEMLELIRRLANEGQITLSRGGDAFV